MTCRIGIGVVGAGPTEFECQEGEPAARVT
jgi:hypothetical protein